MELYFHSAIVSMSCSLHTGTTLPLPLYSNNSMHSSMQWKCLSLKSVTKQIHCWPEDFIFGTQRLKFCISVWKLPWPGPKSLALVKNYSKLSCQQGSNLSPLRKYVLFSAMWYSMPLHTTSKCHFKRNKNLVMWKGKI